VATYEKRCYDSHWGLLASQTILAQTYLASGRKWEGLSLLKRVVATKKKVLPENSPSLLESRRDLAIAHLGCGQRTEVASLLRQVVAVCDKTLPKEDELRVSAQYDLAVVYGEMGKVNEALALLKPVISAREKSSPEEHAELLEAQVLVAELYLRIDKTEEAFALLKKVVAPWNGTQVDVPRIEPALQSKIMLAELYIFKHEEMERGWELLEQVMRTQSRPDTICCPHIFKGQRQLANRFVGTKYWAKGLTLLEHVVKIQKRTLAEDDQDLLLSQAQHALMYWTESRQVSESVALMEHVVGIQKRKATVDDLDLAKFQVILATAYYETGEVGKGAGNASKGCEGDEEDCFGQSPNGFA
jgi:tetratricopeptide (TPR) repeat protein